MNHSPYRSFLRLPLIPQLLKCQSQQSKRYFRIIRRDDAIARGLAAESSRPRSGQDNNYNRDDSRHRFIPRPRNSRPKPDFIPTQQTSREEIEVELPPLKDEAYPESNISTTSPFPPPTKDDRKLAQMKIVDFDFDLAPPPIPPPLIRRAGERPAPRLDRRQTEMALAPPRMNVRRHIPLVGKSSEFIYGTNVVEAAIKSHRRKLYRLYVYAGENRKEDTRLRDAAMIRLAKKHHPDIEIVEEKDLGQLNSMSDSRPHNVCISENQGSPILIY